MMAKLKSSFMFYAVLLCVSIGITPLTPNPVSAGNVELVKISAKEASKVNQLNIEPASLDIIKNTIVLWMNGVQGKEIQIVFEEGKTCRDVTVNPNLKHPGFFMDSKDCFTTSFLPYSSTSSLQFPQAGKFTYMVVTEDGEMVAYGKINVRP